MQWHSRDRWTRRSMAWHGTEYLGTENRGAARPGKYWHTSYWHDMARQIIVVFCLRKMATCLPLKDGYMMSAKRLVHVKRNYRYMFAAKRWVHFCRKNVVYVCSEKMGTKILVPRSSRAPVLHDMETALSRNPKKYPLDWLANQRLPSSLVTSQCKLRHTWQSLTDLQDSTSNSTQSLLYW